MYMNYIVESIESLRWMENSYYNGFSVTQKVQGIMPMAVKWTAIIDTIRKFSEQLKTIIMSLYFGIQQSTIVSS